MEDPSGQLDFASAKRQEFQYATRTHPPSFGFTDKVFWLKCPIENVSDSSRLVLTLDHIYLNSVRLFEDSSSGVREHAFGLNYALKSPEVPYYGYAVELDLPVAERADLYLRVSSEYPVALPLTLMPIAAFQNQVRILDRFFWFFIGVITILIAYNFFIFLSVRDRAYLYYIFALFSLHLFSTLAQYGVVRAYVFPHWRFFHTHVFSFTHTLAVMSVYLFASHFLQLAKTKPLCDRLLRIPVFINLTLLFVGLFINTFYIDLFYQLSSSIFSLSLLGVSAVMAFQGHRQGVYFFVSWAFMIGFWMVTFLRIDGVVPLNLFTNYSILIGACLEGVLLSLALADRLNQLRREKEAAEKQALELVAKSDVMRQVAHDIRSPLAALEVAVRNGENLDESARILLARAVSRIRDITNDLRSQETGAANQPGEARTTMLAGLVDLIVSEKRLQYAGEAGLEIQWKVEERDLGKFVEVEPTAFKRVVSNLIDNGVEAMKKHPGKITVSVSGVEGFHVLTIQDQGMGIPAKILPLLGVKPVTYGKQDTAAGSGLGVYHAAEMVRAWGGVIRFENRGEGASVSVFLPSRQAPSWFVPELRLRRNQQLVIVDDDPLIERAWLQRFEGLPVRLGYFSSPESLLAASAQKQIESDALLLIDLEFRNSELDGLAIISRLSQESLLVTNNFDDPNIQNRCLELGVRLLPKSSLSGVPIRCEAESSEMASEIVLIDDDALVRMAWELAARARSASCTSYASFSEFWMNKGRVSLRTPVYLDGNLPGELSTSQMVARLKEAGYETVYIATGSPRDQFEGISGVRDVLGKDFPI